MSSTNMDVKKNKTATAPVLEFRLPMSEVDSPVKLDSKVEISIPARVVDISDGMITFRKEGQCSCSGMKSELESMREDIGEVEDEEMPFKKD